MGAGGDDVSDESPYRPEFVAALRLLGKACASLRRQGVPLPILVGATASSRGISISCPRPMMPSRTPCLPLASAGRTGRSGNWADSFTPNCPSGWNWCQGPYFDGRADRSRVRIIDPGEGEVCMAPTEDLIVDRIGQWEASSRHDPELLMQAIALFWLAESLDEAYLDDRMKDEMLGAFDLEALRSMGE